MNIFPQPKKIVYNGEFKNTKRNFKPVRDDFKSPDLNHAMSKLEWSDDGIELSIIFKSDLKKEEYYLELGNEGASITASTTRGVFNAIMTLCQAIRQKDLQCFKIEDYPDFEDRGLMIDYSRGCIPSMEYIKETVDLLAEMKYNQLQMAFDAIVFQYDGLEKYYGDTAVITKEYVKELENYCRANMIDLVPNQNGFGHMHEWLKFDDLADLAECPDGFYRTDEYFCTSLLPKGTLNPYDPRSLELVDKIYGGLLPHFEAPFVHCCCDETFDLSWGRGKSHAMVKKLGLKKVYTDYMNKLNALCKKYGKRMMYWADMIIDSVDALRDMPEESIAVVWGYEHEHPFDVQCKNAKESGREFYVAPGSSTWGSIIGRSDNMKYNQQSAAENGRRFGARGYLLTDWSGNIESPTVRQIPVAYGAGVAWGVDENHNVDLACKYIDEVLFFEEGFAKFVYECGNQYTLEPYKRFCVSILSAAMGTPIDDNRIMYDQTPQHFATMIRFVDEKLEKLVEFKNCQSEYIEEIRLNLDMIKTIAKICMIKLDAEVDRDEVINEINDQCERYKNMWVKTKCLHATDSFGHIVKNLLSEIERKN